MTIQLTKDNTGTPDVYSTGDNSDPVSTSVTLDGTGGTEIGAPASNIFVWANDNTGNIDNYSGVSVAISGADTGITWEVSLNGTTGWGSSINLSDLDVSVTFQAVQIYARAVVLNDGTVATNNYVTADIVINATENPA